MGVGVAVGLGGGVGDGLGVAVGEGVAVAVGSGVAVGVQVAVGKGVAEAKGVGVVVTETTEEGERVQAVSQRSEIVKMIWESLDMVCLQRWVTDVGAVPSNQGSILYSILCRFG